MTYAGADPRASDGASIAETIEASAAGTSHRPASSGESPSTICR